jgi:hypothetical protein
MRLDRVDMRQGGSVAASETEWSGRALPQGDQAAVKKWDLEDEEGHL